MKDIKVKNSIVVTVVLLGVASVFFIGWNRHEKTMLPPQEYVKWVKNPEHGLNILKNMKDFNFIVQYEPSEFIVANFEKDPKLKTTVLKGQKSKYTDLQYYTLQIAYPNSGKDMLTIGVKDQKGYLDRENYYSFDFENAIYLIENGVDTLRCALFNYAPNYGIAPHLDFLLAFKKDKKEIENDQAMSDKTLVIQDEIFGNGTLNFIIKKDDINKTPMMLTY